jgi:hypothetical protein
MPKQERKQLKMTKVPFKKRIEAPKKVITKKFNGETFKLEGGYLQKSQAEKVAKNLRKKGGRKVRIVKGPEKRYGNYEVFVK